MKKNSFLLWILENVVCQLLQHLWLGRRLELLWCKIITFALRTNLAHSVIFESAPKYCISDSSVNHVGCSISSKGILPTVVDVIVIWYKFIHPHTFKIPDLYDFDVQSCHLLFAYIQYTLIHGLNNPVFYAILFFTTFTFRLYFHHQTLLSPPDTSIIEHHFHFGPGFHLSGVISNCLPLFPVAYFSPSKWYRDFCCHIFLSFHIVHGVLQARILEQVPFPSPVDHVFQNSSLSPIHLGWPCRVWLTAPLSYTSPFATTRLWSMKWPQWQTSP